MKNRLNIAWYTRDGDLDFFVKISKKIALENVEIEQFYVCHTISEREKLESVYNVTPTVLGNFYSERIDNIGGDLEELKKQYETRYNSVPLRQIAWSEMFELGESDDVLLPRIIVHFEFWEKYLKQNEIDVIISEGPGVLTASVLWSVCKTMGIHFIEFTPVGLPGRKNFRTTWKDSIEGIDDAILNSGIDKSSENYSEAVKYYEKMNTTPEKPPYVGIDLISGEKIGKQKSYYKYPGIPSIKKLAGFYSKIKSRRLKNNYYLKGNYMTKYKKWLLSFFRLKYINFSGVFEKYHPHNQENYFLFPLHILNEWCDYTWMGLRYPNIIELIRECAACLPFNTKLYVKEHPSLFPEKSIKFYKALKKIRNVKLLSPYEDTFSLTKNCRGVLTLGGTTGWEAFLIGKPVILLADNWYKNFPGIMKVSNHYELSEILQQPEKLTLPDKEEIIRIIYILRIISFEGAHYPQVLMYADENIRKHADGLLNHLATKINLQNYFK